MKDSEPASARDSAQFTVMVAIGTRPEAIKLWPVIEQLGKTEGINLHVCLTAQHRDLLDMFVQELGIPVHSDLNLMKSGQTLGELSGRLIPAVDELLHKLKPDLVMVQGDTTTAALTSLTAFYAGIRVAHVEAGLRSGDKWSPFPEEVNRRVATVVADLHFAPTPQARENLLAEGVADQAIVVTGNTVIDAVQHMAKESHQSASPRILMTAHRRENFGAPLQEIFKGVKQIAERFPEVTIVYPVHPNPNVREPAHAMLEGLTNVQLLEPLGYQDFVSEMQQSWFIVSDSGGVQEEATALGRPVLLLRNETERPEGVEAGNVAQVLLQAGEVEKAIAELLEDEAKRSRMSRISDVYGDGCASVRIASSTLTFLQSGR